jgi:hypothetical protein
MMGRFSLPLWRLCGNSSLSLRATEGSVAISLFSMPYEIASVVSLPRNGNVTQSLGERKGRLHSVAAMVFLRTASKASDNGPDEAGLVFLIWIV